MKREDAATTGYNGIAVQDVLGGVRIYDSQSKKTFLYEKGKVKVVDRAIIDHNDSWEPLRNSAIARKVKRAGSQLTTRDEAVAQSPHKMAWLRDMGKTSNIYNASTDTWVLMRDGVISSAPQGIEPNPDYPGWESLEDAGIAQKVRDFLNPKSTHPNNGRMKILAKSGVSLSIRIECHCGERFTFSPDSHQNTIHSENLVTTAVCPSCKCQWNGQNDAHEPRVTRFFALDFEELQDNNPTGRYIPTMHGASEDPREFLMRALYSKDDFIGICGLRLREITEEQLAAETQAASGRLYSLGRMLLEKLMNER